MIEIKNGITISEDSFVYRASRSGGPGGQNVNKVNTRITLFFDVAGCETLTEEQKRLILTRLKTRASKAGVLRVVSQRFRTQKANRDAATKRLIELLQQALTKKRVRKKTRVPARAKQKRLDEKKRRSTLKKLRSEKDFS